MVKVIFDTETATIEEAANFLEYAAERIREGETQVGLYGSAEWNMMVTETDESGNVIERDESGEII